MNKINLLKIFVVAGLLFACGKDKHHKDPAPVSGSIPEAPPIIDNSEPNASAPFVRFSETSLVECQVNDYYATNCRLTNQAQTMVLAKGMSSDQPVSIEVKCSAGKSNVDFSFRLRFPGGATPTVIDCRKPEAQVYKVQGSGDLELLVENPGLLGAIRVSKNFVIEVKSIDGVAFVAK